MRSPGCLPMGLLAVLLVALLCCLPAIAAEPALKVRGDVALGDYIQIDVEGVAEAELAAADLTVWPIKQTNVLSGKAWGGNPYVLFRAKVPTGYLVKLAILRDGKLVTVQTILDLGGTPPDPQPGPGPQPSPGQPIAHLVVVEESSQRTPEQAQAIASQKVRQALAAKGIQWHLADKDSKATWAQAYARLAGAELPRAFAVSADDRIVEQFSLPDEAKLLDWISKQRGTK